MYKSKIRTQILDPLVYQVTNDNQLRWAPVWKIDTCDKCKKKTQLNLTFFGDQSAWYLCSDCLNQYQLSK